MMLWCGRRLTRVQTNTWIHMHARADPPSSSPSLHHHANPACFTRRETERLIVIPQGSADLSQICAAVLIPHHSFISSFFFLAPRNQKISHLGDLLEMWEICEWSSLPGGFLTRAAGRVCGESWAKMEQEKEGGRLYSCSELLRAAKPKWFWCWEEVPGRAGFSCPAIKCHRRCTENSSRRYPWRMHVSLLERPELVNKWCPVSSSLPHRKESCLDLF